MNSLKTHLICAVLLCALANQKTRSQDDPAAFLKSTMPGESHKKLQTLEGSWNLMLKVPAGPDGKPAEVKGTATYKSILGGRFIQEAAKTELFGQPFEWVGLYGFDNNKKKFVASWADNFNTIIEHGEGDADHGGKSIALVGDTIKPGGSKEKFHWVITFPVDGKLTIEMYSVNAEGARGQRIMEITGTKAK